MRITSIIIAFTLSQIGLLDAQQTTPKLNSEPLYQEAIGALQDHLPVIASEKFNLLLKEKIKSKSLTKEQHLELIFLLAESQIRANKPQEAIQSLSNKLLAEQPDAIFWRGHALAAAGRYNEAIETLEKAKPDSKHYQLGQLKSANLAIALGDLNKALEILKLSIKNSKKVSSQTYLSLANLYLAKKDQQNAAQALIKFTPENPEQTRAKQILLAQVSILEKKFDPAISTLQTLLSEENLRSNTQNFAALLLADTYKANGENEKAINTLIEYIDKQPGSLISPMFAKLGQWLPNDTPITSPTITKLTDWANIGTDDPVGNTPPNSAVNDDLKAFAHYYYAKFLSNKPDSADKTKAVQVLEELRQRFPSHILSGSSLSLSANTLLTLGRVHDAKETLERIQKLTTPIDPQAKLQASLLLGKLNLDDQNYAQAALAYKTMLESADDNIRTTATMNAASSYLAANDANGFLDLQRNTDDPNLQQDLKLEHALWAARNLQLDARTKLHSFITKHPKHPRIDDARLSLALHCLNINPTDHELANLITPTVSQANLLETQKVDFFYLKYRNSMIQKDFAEAANIADRFIKRFPEHPSVPEFTLHRGQALYHNGQHNPARQLLNGMVKKHPKHPLKDYAEYYAAMSAKREGSPQSEKEAIELLTNITDSKSVLAEEARLQLARLLIQTNQPGSAVKALDPIYKTQPKNKKNLQLSLTLAAAYQNLADTDEEYFQSSLNIYNDLTTQFENNDQVVNEIKYEKAKLLQHLGKDNEALAIYYSVVDIDIRKQPITEWFYYYECGFRAITMLEAMENPKAAIAIANKLIESKGKRAQDAALKVNELKKKYMIW